MAAGRTRAEVDRRQSVVTTFLAVAATRGRAGRMPLTMQCRPHSAETTGDMLWSFHRGGEHLVYEIRTRANAPGFELIIRKPDGAETTEYFDDHVAVDRRAEELQRELLDTGWWLAGDPRR